MRDAIVRETNHWSKRIPEGIDPEVREVLLDPLDSEEIGRLAQWAEHPDLADPIIALLPKWKSNDRIEDAFLRMRKAALRASMEGSGIDPSSLLADWRLPVKLHV